jgi:hypothetical protein
MVQDGIAGIIIPGIIRHGTVPDITIIMGIIAIIVLIMEDIITNIIILTVIVTAAAPIILMDDLLMGVGLLMVVDLLMEAGLLRWDAVRGELLLRDNLRLIIQAVHLLVPPVYLPAEVR